MSGLTRRKLLQGSVAPGGLVGAGCTALLEETQETYVKEISVLNRDPATYTVSMLLVEDGEPVYWDSVDVDAYSADSDTVGSAEFENYPTEPGAYTLYVWRDDQPRSAWAEYDLREYDLPCVKFLVILGRPSDDRRRRVSLRPSAGCPDEEIDDS